MSKETKTYFLFIKIGEEEHIQALQKEGHIYCNSLEYFRSIESSDIRSDKNEGKSSLFQMYNLEVYIDGEPIAKAPRGQLYQEDPDIYGCVYSMYGVESSLIDHTINKKQQRVIIQNRVGEFGKSALLVHHPQEFIKRIKNSLEEQSISHDFSPVYYYDPTDYEGKLSPFFKSNLHSWQNEVRLWIPTKTKTPFQFYIGDISDISYIISVDELDKIEVEIL